MRVYDPAFINALSAARDGGIAPRYFLHITAKDRDTGADTPFGLWSGDEDITVNVEIPSGGLSSRTYLGGCNLTIDGLQYVGDLTDNPVTATMSQIAPAAQELVRGLDARHAYCEIHATSMVGGAFVSVPQLLWVGVVDEAPISTPAAGGEGGISLTIRSELMAQLTATNPAKSSHAHQQRRQAGDDFSKFASTVAARKLTWFTGDE